jgi:hypothetical protein
MTANPIRMIPKSSHPELPAVRPCFVKRGQLVLTHGQGGVARGFDGSHEGHT